MMFKKKNGAFFSQQFKFFSKNLKEKKRIWRLHIRIKTSLFWDYFVSLKQVLQEFVEIKVRNQVAVILVEKELG